MSKQRPSRSRRSPAIFRNSYTRNGRQLRVKGWSVKIQFQGIRRTCALRSRRREDALLEARELHEQIRTSGWSAVEKSATRRESETIPGGGTDFFPRHDLRYWRQRLLRRRPAGASSSARGIEFSARLEHSGISHYFPLGSDNPDAAAARARDLYQQLLQGGWEQINQKAEREITLAIHWADNPLAWTYTTLLTLPGPMRISPSSFSQAPRTVVRVHLVEPESSLRRALADCLNRIAGVAAIPLAAWSASALHSNSARGSQLLLMNQGAHDRTPASFLASIREASPVLPVLFYSVYEDSDQLFKSTPGGASGYLLKRTPASRLLEPISPLLGQSLLTQAKIALQVRQYFQNVVTTLSAGEVSPDVARLTHREQEILNLLSKGFLDKEIALHLRISVWTVHGHLKNIFEKLNVHTRTEAAIKYLQK